MEIYPKDASYYIPGIGKYFKLDNDDIDLDTLTEEDVDELWGINIEDLVKPVDPPEDPVEPDEEDKEETPEENPETPDTDDNEPTDPLPEVPEPEPEEPEEETDVEEKIIYDGTYLLAPRTFLTVVVGTWEIIIREAGNKVVQGEYATNGVLLRRFPDGTYEIVNIATDEVIFPIDNEIVV